MPTLIVRDEAQTWLVDLPAQATWTLGRSPDCELLLVTARASRRHVQVAMREGRCFVSDLNSTNGTLLNGAPLMQEQELAEGDEIQIGDCSVQFRSRP